VPALAIAILPSAAQPRVRYETTDSESYWPAAWSSLRPMSLLSGRSTNSWPQVPAVTIMLEYDDLKSAQRRRLRAVDGRIVVHHAV